MGIRDPARGILDNHVCRNLYVYILGAPSVGGLGLGGRKPEQNLKSPRSSHSTPKHASIRMGGPRGGALGAVLGVRAQVAV